MTEPAKTIERLLAYAVNKELIDELDVIFVRNRLLNLLQLNKPSDIDYTAYLNEERPNAVEIIQQLLDYTVEEGLIDDTVTSRDLFDTKIMGLITPMPSTIAEKFNKKSRESGIESATNYFYTLCKDVNYIRTERIAKNKQWTYSSRYGNIEITINLSKPEKDPLELKKALNTPSAEYPKCKLCIENMGYEGRLNFPARQNHRLIPLKLLETENSHGENWYFQYSPYVYYNEHCIVIFEKHKPMNICRQTFERLLEFLGKFPHYFIGSNTDLPIVGGSILEHEHYQGGRYEMPMVDAAIEDYYTHPDFEDAAIETGILNWPLSGIRLRSKNSSAIVEMADRILKTWRAYSDETVGILNESESDGTIYQHNTVTPISRKKEDGTFEMDIVLRNNRTSETYPMGIFHPHPQYHHIKKENIGLIEVMGLAILPGRLERELEQIVQYLTGKKRGDPLAIDNENELYKHRKWIREMLDESGIMDENEAFEFVKDEIGKRFTRVLENAGVYKKDEKGRSAFHKFMRECGFELK